MDLSFRLFLALKGKMFNKIPVEALTLNIHLEWALWAGQEARRHSVFDTFSKFLQPPTDINILYKYVRFWKILHWICTNLGPVATDPRKLYKLLVVSTGQSGQGMSHYHYGQVVLGMPGLDHILLLRKCVYIRLISTKLLWTLNEWCFQKKEEHKKAIPNAHICASGGGHNLGARACKACRYFLYVLLVTLPENSAYWHLTSNWGCEYNEICWVTNCRQ